MEVKAFYKDAVKKLEFEPIWFNDEHRATIGEAFGLVVRKFGYTVWSCAVMHGHAHLNARVHRDPARDMWIHFAEASRDAIRSMMNVPDHPVWSSRPYAVYEYNPPDVQRVNKYIFGNPEKEHLAPQTWDFVIPYDNWPWHKRPAPNPNWR